MLCPDCGDDKRNHWAADPEDGTDPTNYAAEPYTCRDCCECNETFDPGDEIDHAMMLADEYR